MSIPPFALLFFFCILFAPCIVAQYPPASDLTTITSPVDGDITISYKTPPNGTCATVYESQQQYTGWVNIPGDYPTNTFFWFIQGRSPTDQLTIWLNGGPGTSSLFGLFNENGPCEAVEFAENQIATIERQWGWDRGSNMLYIDQPNQVGFSYDTPTNGSLDLLTNDLYTPAQQRPNSQAANTFLNGTFSSLNSNNTANTTEIAAMAIWHMLQGFLGAFPQYVPDDNSSLVGINLFTESYGGKYGPAFASLWEEQNALRANGTISQSDTIDVKLVSLGIVNGCVDDLIQAPYYPVMAVNNTYDITAINPTRAALANASFYASGGCQDLIKQCRTAVTASDPDDDGNVESVNSLCATAYNSCLTNVMEPYFDAGRSVYDISHYTPDPFPPSTYLEYMNNATFLEAIGSPVNFTETSQSVVDAFSATGDYEREYLVPKLATLLNSGIRVGLMYGDRDYICNWLGGEQISLEVASQAGGAYANTFPVAGYAPVITNSTYIGGVVRQFGNLSFSRIYDAGHSVPAYQPETAFQVFARIIMGTSLSTGETIDLTSYNTTGSANATHTNSLPTSPSPTCWIRDVPDKCTDDQTSMLAQGEGVVINGVLYAASSDYTGITSVPTSTSTGDSGSGTQTSVTTTTVYTGFYTATATPSSGGSPVLERGSSAAWSVAAVALSLFMMPNLAWVL